MRQQLKEAVKWVFYWSLDGVGWVESRLTPGSILKLLLAVAGGNFPIFVVMFPKKVEQENVAHSVKNDPKDLGMLINLPIDISWGCSFIYLWNFWLKEVHKKFDGGDKHNFLSEKCWSFELMQLIWAEFLLLHIERLLLITQ